MVKVYFGPYRHSPVDELPLDERRLWYLDMHLLRGFDRDFWTSNPLHLDVFDPCQVYLWDDERWQPLPAVTDRYMPARRTDPELRGLSVGRLALAVLFVAAVREAEALAWDDGAGEPDTRH